MAEEETPEQQPAEEQPVEGQQPKAKLTDKRWFKPALMALAAIIAAAAAWLVFAGSPDEAESPAATETNEQPAETTQQSVDHPSELLYAYKEDTNTIVRSLDWESKEKTDILTFEEERGVEKRGNFYAGLDPSVDYEPADKELAYIEEDELKTMVRGSDETEELISQTGGEDFSGTAPDWSIDFANTSGPSVFSIFSPDYSVDGSLLAYMRGHYEGSSIGVFNPADMIDLNVGDTFRYGIDPLDEELSFSKAENGEAFKQFSEYGDYYLDVRGAYVLDSNLSPNGEHVAMTIALHDGENVSVTEDSDVMLVLINTETLEHEFLGNAKNYRDNLAFSSDSSQLFAVRKGNNNDSYAIEQWSVSSRQLMTTYNVKSSYVVDGTYQSVQLSSFDKVYASIKTKTGSEYNIIVVDVTGQEQLADFLVSDVSRFKILYSKQ